jgi:hypothetical protein
MERCFCNKLADCLCTVYNSKGSTLKCYDCAEKWLKETSRCPKCGNTSEAHNEHEFKCKYGKGKQAGPLDRGFSTTESKLGTKTLGNHKLWVTSATLGKNEDIYSEYYLVLLTKIDNGWNFYVNIPKSEFGDMFKLDRRNMATDETDMVEYRYYEAVRDHQLPLCKLSRKHLNELMARLVGVQP